MNNNYKDIVSLSTKLYLLSKQKKFKFYIDYRLNEYKDYDGYTALNMSCNNQNIINFLHNLLYDFLVFRIDSNLKIKLKLLLDNADKLVSIAYGGYNNDYYRIYIHPNKKILEILGLNIKNIENIHTIGVNLLNFNIKVYMYTNSVQYINILEKIGIIEKPKFILKMVDSNNREKLYFRFNDFSYKNQKSLFNFTKGVEGFLDKNNIKEIYINYIAINLENNEKQIYFVDKDNYFISNN